MGWADGVGAYRAWPAAVGRRRGTRTCGRCPTYRRCTCRVAPTEAGERVCHVAPRGAGDDIPLASEEGGVVGGGIDHRVVRAHAPLAARLLPRRRRVALRVLHDRVVARLRPVRQELVLGVVGGHGLREEGASGAAGPVLLVAEAGVDLHHALALAAGARAVNHKRRAREDGLIVVLGLAWRPDAGVEAVPDGDGKRGPGDKVLGHKVAIVGAVTRHGCEVDLVKVMEDTVDWIKDGAIRVVLAAAVLIHEVVHGRILEGLRAELVAGVARPVEACCCKR